MSTRLKIAVNLNLSSAANKLKLWEESIKACDLAIGLSMNSPNQKALYRRG